MQAGLRRVPLTNEMHLCAIMKSGASRCTTATVAARKPTGSFTSQSARLCPTRSGPPLSSATSWLPTRTSSRERYFEGRCTFNFYYFFSPADSSRGSVGYRSQPDDDSRLLALLQSRRRQLQVNFPEQLCLRFIILSQGARNQVGLSADLTVPRRWPAGGRQTYLELLQNNRNQYQNVKHLYFQSRGACAGPDRCHL